MDSHNVREARERLSQLLDQVAAGEQVTITRRGKPVARLIPAVEPSIQFPDRGELRRSLPPAGEPAVDLVRRLREEERY